MATFTKLDLSEDFKTHAGITEVHESFRGGQKNVFIVSRKTGKHALKIFLNFGEREIRELKIYDDFQNHPNIPRIVEQFDYEKHKVVVESYIEGECLENICARFKGDHTKIKVLIKDIATVLRPFWEGNPPIIHRDIKPSNIIVSPDGHANVIDFGIARILGEDSITDTGAPQPGTWKFASPEQYFSKKDLISYRTDFFSLGVLSYFLYYGELPFGNTINEIAENYKKDPLVYSTKKECALNDLFKNCLRATPAERPRSPGNLLSLLE